MNSLQENRGLIQLVRKVMRMFLSMENPLLVHSVTIRLKGLFRCKFE